MIENLSGSTHHHSTNSPSIGSIQNWHIIGFENINKSLRSLFRPSLGRADVILPHCWFSFLSNAAELFPTERKGIKEILRQRQIIFARSKILFSFSICHCSLLPRIGFILYNQNLTISNYWCLLTQRSQFNFNLIRWFHKATSNQIIWFTVTEDI